ncbi:ribokinase [Flexivirga caeni]|uniref:Ribokinase n=1 Tax=Flexivirga caeni TaxID=2294115 RepID=A0A3M9MHV1_9MICO|nr:ribokinase [Flexivirga caeni]RNI24238.1 ribokinase [Flexivirga caeni]
MAANWRPSTGRREMGRVVVVGSLNDDLVLRTPALPGAGETIRASEGLRTSGGKGGNQAIAARRYGADTCFVGAVGGDPISRRMQNDLAREGVDISALAVIAGAQPGTAVVTVDSLGENHIVISPGANDLVDGPFVQARLDALAPSTADVVVTGFEIPISGSMTALSRGRRAGSELILNPSPVEGFAREILQLQPIVVCNRHEATQIAGIVDAEHAARHLASLTDRDVIITLGGEGTLAILDGETHRFAASKVAVVDTTGAGDVFCGTFAAARARGYDMTCSIVSASEAASLSVTRRGAR